MHDLTYILNDRLNVDPRHGDQIVRGTAKMPAGLGKSKKLCVFCSESQKAKALEAGADMFGDEEVVKNVIELFKAVGGIRI